MSLARIKLMAALIGDEVDAIESVPVRRYVGTEVYTRSDEDFARLATLKDIARLIDFASGDVEFLQRLLKRLAT